MKNSHYLFIATIIAGSVSCRKTEFAEVERTNGEADFTHYIAVGNSLTQGYQDGGVFEEGQENSYPAIIARQMNLVQNDMDDFEQPMVNGNGSGYMHLEYINGEIEVISPGDTLGTPTEEDASWADWGTSMKSIKYNNLGISGITLMQCVALNDEEMIVNNGILGGFSLQIPPFIDYEVPGNPFARFMDFGGNPHMLIGGTPIQYIDHIRNSEATFFTSWLGDNDVLGYATSGGIPTEIDGTLLGLGVIQYGNLSDPVAFRQKYDSVLTAFSSIGAQGVCATIPDVTVIPYFNTFTVAGIKEDYGYADVWIEEGDGNGGVVQTRVATDEDLILLTASDDIEAGAGSSETNPLTNGRVLDKNEVLACQSRTIELNNAIKASAASFGYPVVDMYDFLDRIKPGIMLEGIGISPEYIGGGAFSLDGVHLNPRGYAIAANEFIKVINEHYGSNIPLAQIGSYRGVIFP
ncbi:MAG: SGNH/GDSL hydrolase family protein [Crocinitomicaceae bacterium]|nr:SGNH/GDSL hydrolase family protein [Crocinitomicaceae bacterium]